MKVGKGGEPPDHHAEPIDWDCKVGLCGMCVVQIVEGADNFEPADPRELDCLANKAMVDPDPKQFRLACVAKIKGPVKLTNPS
jgi:ferredoxin